LENLLDHFPPKKFKNTGEIQLAEFFLLTSFARERRLQLANKKRK